MTDFVGGEKKFATSVNTPGMQRLEVRKKREQHIFPLKSCIKMAKKNFIFLFNAWVEKIKNRVFINKFMVSETPLSYRRM